MKHLKFIFSLIICILLISCEKGEVSLKQMEQNDEAETTSISTNDTELNGQLFSIISTYQGMQDYIDEARDKGDSANLRLLYMEHVFTPVWEACYKDGEYLSLINNYTANPPTNLNKLESDIERMSKRNIEEIVKEALLKSAEALPGPDTNVCILPYNEHAGGIGVNVGAGKITLYFNEQILYSDKEIAGTIAHEYHHSVWTDNYYESSKMTLLDYLIFEGRAESFKHMIYPEARVFTIPSSLEEQHWIKVSDSLESLDWNLHQQVMFGGGGFPSFYGYALGFNIVQDFIEHNPTMSVEEWTALSAEEIFNGSNYENSFK